MAPETYDFSEKVGVLVVGAGPTGLGAATRLHQHGCKDWLLIDSAPEPGGLACTDCTPEGFLYDMGGHVIFSHCRYFDELVDAGLEAAEALPCPNDPFWEKQEEGQEEKAAGGKSGKVTSISASSKHWNTLQRVSYVRLKGRWVAYPFQNNISALSDEDKVSCLTGLAAASVESSRAAGTKPANFDEWILRSMGAGIADLFMRPYNFKVWAHPTTEMASEWLGERVAAPDVSRALGNVIRNVEDARWGPNAVFRFPKRGGTGAIWRGVGSLLPRERRRFGAGNAVVGIDVDEKLVELADGSKIRYECLVSTLPLDSLLLMAKKGMGGGRGGTRGRAWGTGPKVRRRSRPPCGRCSERRSTGPASAARPPTSSGSASAAPALTA